jgi:crossover junction endodeoxyribonuclease RusA
LLVQISFPIEFVVPGTAVSQQAKRSKSKKEWKERVKNASYASLPENHFAHKGPVCVTIFIFPDGEMGDIDNIIKPILDALRQHIYMDDSQVQQIVARKFEPGYVFAFTAPSEILQQALVGARPLVYVRLSDNQSEGLV